ncbi:unnamed protein product [Microthlaspi erraticum]|uniref:Uncharacterized protein n=1 Tax=Microthlaspi erraticum TaxID=1685480 RepID=A0A6D2I0N9_9BRAS|nr:unnamed protein product [Microthlaspi erraticum]
MIGSYYSSLSFFLRTIVLLLFSILNLFNTFASLTPDLCHQDQRDTLLDFKNELKIQKPDEVLDFEGYPMNVTSYPKTDSWTNTNSDCCNWEGVTCDTSSGKVIGLDLSCSCLHGRLEPNTSLFRLQHLQTLNLAYNNFTFSPFPAKFHKLVSLQRLNLSQTSLTGQIPTEILQLTSLVSLDLSSSFSFSPSLLAIESPLFFRLLAKNLRSLRALDMSGVNISFEIPHELTQLSVLLLFSNDFTGEVPSSVGNLKQLVGINVAYNSLTGNFPSALLNLTKLRVISLSSNQFTGPLPPNMSQLSKLESFFAGDNFFTGAIPASLFNISSLSYIYLEDNYLTDIVGIENISLLPNLQYFFIYRNKFRVSPLDLSVFSSLKQLSALGLSGIPLSTTNITSGSEFPSHLKYLYLSGCNITEFPEFLRDQANLQTLDISNNKIQGQVPNWLWRLQGLEVLFLSSNSLSGFNGSLNPLPGSQIDVLDLSSNAFQGPLFLPSTVIRYLFASKNNFTGEIPPSVCELTSPSILDLSNNNFNGSIPRCLETQMMTSISDLNLHSNSLTGSLPDIFTNAERLRSIDVSHNRLHGKLPESLTLCSALEVLNVESNEINDTFPFHLSSLQKLQVLVLRSNKLHGMLHHHDSSVNGVWFGFPQLKIIDVSHNDFSGALPSDYFMNWTAITSKKDDDYTQQVSYIGDFHDYGYYTSVVLMNKGVSMAMQRILTIYTAIDFSGNRIHGQVPESIGLLKELHVLNLSRNAFTGHIPSSLANLTALESLDVSQNKLSGEIPPKLGDLSSLGWINVSHNELVGPIPQGTQFQRQNCSSYEGNTGLFGASLKDICGDIRESEIIESSSEEEEEEEEEEKLCWIAAGIGFAPGIVLGLTIGYIVASYKQEWFMKTVAVRNNKHWSTR